jgi:5-methylcytosine-specific restriction endonuclease McrA
MNNKTLLLDSSYVAVCSISWQKALVLLLKEKADLLEEYEEVARSPSIEMNIPAVIRLRSYFEKKRRTAKFTRNAVCTRDNSQCCYCTKKLQPKDVTFDHVYPKSRGGKGNDWLNIVTACKSCNQKKGNRTPEEAGMRLITKTYVPTYFRMIINQKYSDLWDKWLGIE